MEHPPDGAQWCLRCGSDDESTTLQMRAATSHRPNPTVGRYSGGRVVATLRRDHWPKPQAFRREKELPRTVTVSGRCLVCLRGFLTPASRPRSDPTHRLGTSLSFLAHVFGWVLPAISRSAGGGRAGAFSRMGKNGEWLQGPVRGREGREGRLVAGGKAVRTRATSDAPPVQIQCWTVEQYGVAPKLAMIS
jgi:hypothetical protein